MRQLRLSHRAALELDELNYYGTLKYGPVQAEIYYRQLQRMIGWLSEYPFRYREHDEIRPPVRLMPFGAHNIFYEVTETEVIVTRVLHHSADWINEL